MGDGFTLAQPALLSGSTPRGSRTGPRDQPFYFFLFHFILKGYFAGMDLVSLAESVAYHFGGWGGGNDRRTVCAEDPVLSKAGLSCAEEKRPAL